MGANSTNKKKSKTKQNEEKKPSWTEKIGKSAGGRAAIIDSILHSKDSSSAGDNKIKSILSKREENKTQKSAASMKSMLYLVRGQADGKPLWHYVLVDKIKNPLFLEALTHADIDVEAYGKVIASGWGQDPSKEEQDRIESMY